MFIGTSKNPTFLPSYYYRNFFTWILGHGMRHKILFFSGYILLFLGSSVSVIIPVLLQQFFDDALISGIDAIISISLQFILVSFVYLIVSVLATSINSVASEYMIRDVQTEFFESIHQKSMKFHDSARTGDLLSMATSDSRTLSWMISSLRMLALAIFTTINVAIAMIYLDINNVLFFIFLMFMPPVIWSLYRYGKNLGPISLRRQELFAKYQSTLQENLAGTRALRTLSNKEREFAKYDQDLTAVRDILIKRAIISERYFPRLYISILMGSLFLVGGLMVLDGDMSPGTLIAFNSLALLLQRPNDMIRISVFLGSMGLAGGRRVFRVINLQQQMEEGSFASELHGEVEFQNVSFKYNDTGPYTIKNINFHVSPGKTVAILGPTGSGKTTLIKLIQRLYNVSDGKILIDKKNIRDFQLNKLRSRIGVIEQDVFLFSATIKENILYGIENAFIENLEDKMIEVAKAAQIHDFILTLPKKYDTIIGERGVTLSGGQRQRLAIARAFMINPSILIMDDSTASVDAATEYQIQKAIKNLIKSRTTFIITHRLSTFRNADLVILLKDGQITDIGKHEELYQRQEDYASIFQQYEDLPAITTNVMEGK
ncbi:MAG: ABC transporter ATP-binding protein [Candidatus Hodarchaeales archaeon]